MSEMSMDASKCFFTVKDCSCFSNMPLKQKIKIICNFKKYRKTFYTNWYHSLAIMSPQYGLDFASCWTATDKSSGIFNEITQNNEFILIKVT